MMCLNYIICHKNSTTFKQHLNDLRKVQGIINNISNVEVWANGTSGLLTAESFNSLKIAVSLFSEEQATFTIIISKVLNQAQIYLILSNKEVMV